MTLTLAQAFGFALLLALFFVMLTAWITFALCNNHLWKVVTPLKTELDLLKKNDIELVTVTVHEVRYDTFVKIERFGEDLCAALSYIDQHKVNYNLYLKVRKRSGEYISLYLIAS